MPLQIYDTFSNEKKLFEPIDPSNVRMYVCGPTVYDFPHVGNARPVIVFDLLFRLLRRIYGIDNVTYVRNITDVDDKIIAAASENNEDIKSLTERTIKFFHDDADYIGALEPTFEPKATDYINDMINIISCLIEKDYAYVSEDNVLFSASKFSKYGQLSGKNLEEMIAGSRVEVESFKRSSSDFVLWKPSKSSEPGWDSPWGKGRPGWHIECSAMSIKYLGKNFEIHGGGRDLIFPHHENEIAQSESFTSEQFAKIWMHAGMITINGEKMSKSVGNVKSINHVLESWGPNVARLFCISGHYSKPIDYTEDLLKENLIRLRQIETCYYELRLAQESQETEDISSLLEESREKFDAALNDDFNTSLGLSVFFNMIKTINSLAADEKISKKIAIQALPVLEYMLEVLGIEIQTVSDEEIESIFELINKRETLREEKQFEEADKIRDQIAGLGISLIDHKNKTLWMKKEAIKSEKQ